MLFLAKFTLETTPYEGRTETKKVTQLIEANSVDEASRKLNAHYEGKSVDYSVSYRVTEEDILETIV